ncbi:PAS domain S-box protein [Thermodesulfobacteriota bacterium]
MASKNNIELNHRASEKVSLDGESQRGSEEWYRALFNGSLDCVYIHDFEGNFIDANPVTLSLLEITKEELRSLNFTSILSPDQIPLAMETLKEIRTTGSQKKLTEFVIKKKNGEHLYLETKGSVLYQNGKAYAIQGIARDITRLKQSEKALKESENRFRKLFEHSKNAVLIHKSGKIIDVNDETFRLLGYNREQLLSMRAEDLHAESEYSESRERIRHVQSGESIVFETTFVKADGSQVPVEVSSNIVDYKKEIIQGIVRDITERKRTAEALLESEEKYKNILESIEEAYFEVDLKGNFTFFNDSLSTISNYSREELMGMNNRDYMPTDSAKKIYKLFNKIYKTGKPVKKVRYERITKDGSTSFHELSASLRFDKNGQPIGFRGIAMDVTDLKLVEDEMKKMEAQLAYAQKMEAIGTLAGGIAHNFNNLLMGIQGNASIMLFDIDQGHQYYKNLKNIEQMVKNGSKLTGQLLGYAREGNYEIRPISINELVTETSQTFGETKKEIRINRELGKNLYGVKADQGQIEQVLLNLYVNAADAMSEGGDLNIKTMNVTHEDMAGRPYEPKPGNYILVTIRDTGVGMNGKTTERVFEPFFTTKGLASGTGLGLASAYGIIKAHGGYIEVDSKEGVGTTFRIYLPGTDQAIRDRRMLYTLPQKGHETILMVDDEDIVLDTGSQMLEMLGYNVIKAWSGTDALDLFIKNRDRVDIVLLDMIMPDMGGGETYDRIKEINPDVKVLLSSGYNIDGKATEILERGCNGFIQKPFDINDLSHKIRDILDFGYALENYK